MKFQIEKQSFEEQLLIVSRAINNKTTLPVLNNVLLKVENGNLYFTTTNLEIAIESSITAIESQDGQTTVPVKLLLNYVSLLPAGIVGVELQEKETLHLSCGSSDMTIKCIPSEEFPIIPKITEELSFSVPVPELKNALSQVVFAAALDERRPVLAGVYLKVKNKELILVATDSYRLAEKKLSVDADVETTVIIPSQTILELLRILGKTEEGEIALKVSKNQIIFNIGDVSLTSRLIEGKYPDYEKIIPEKTETLAEISTSDFVTVLKRVNLFAKDGLSGVKYNFKPNGIEVVSDTSQSGTEKTMYDCKVTGPEKSVAFNAEFMIDALNNMGGDTVTLGVNTSLTPGVLKNIEDESYTHIVMPLKI